MDRLAAFLSSKLPEIFHPVQHRQEIWKRDPFDVETVHAQARESFERLLAQATSGGGLSAGRILLLRGDAGCGKTHLARAFRNYAHGRSLGFLGYLQMTTLVEDYPRYLLSNLLESLDLPYDEGREDLNALMKLSAILANRANAELMAEIAGSENLSGQDLAERVFSAADSIVKQAGYRDLDLDLVRAILFLQRDDASVKHRILKYLRCETLAPTEVAQLGGLTSRTAPDSPQRVIEFLGKLMAQVNCSLVICVDQLEDAINFQQGELPFRRMISTLCDLIDRVPSSIVVLCCLEQYWSALRGKLNGAMIDRIEKDPPPVELDALRGEEEIRAIVARRLGYLYEQTDAPLDATAPVDPIPAEFLHSLRQLRTRDVLERCGWFREEWRRTGRPPVSPDAKALPAPSPLAAQPKFAQLWNDFRASARIEVPQDEASLIALLEFGLQRWVRELPSGAEVAVRRVAEGLEVEVNGSLATQRLLVALCNKATQGGGLSRQLAALARHQDRTPILLRSTAFPVNARTKVAQELGDLIAKRGARRAVVEPSEWRTLCAFQEFARQHEGEPGFQDWARAERPVSLLPAFAQTLLFEEVAKLVSKPQLSAFQKAEPSGSPLLRVGMTEGIAKQPMTLQLESLKQHVVFLGGSGSGKTTLAMRIVEQAVLRGVPAILLDRKGDLANYASAEAWTPGGPEAADRADLRAKLDVAVFTPGDPRGRALAIGILPAQLGELAVLERDDAIRHAADGIAAMLGYRDSAKDRQLRAILLQALKLLAQAEAAPDLQRLIDVIGDQDPVLVASVGRLDVRLFQKLAQDLETFRITRAERLFSAKETLDIETLLGRGASALPGKTRLSIISTRFLGDGDAVQFWVTQLLTHLTRWTSRSPSKELQALLLIDEADIYLPAGSKPPTKEPMESLLKRARSAGLGIFLATQSPGDLDYKCRDQVRTWCVGRIKEQTAIAKLKPMLADFNADTVEIKLPKQGAGQFHLLNEKGPRSFLADRSLVAPDQLSEERLLAVAANTRT